MVPGIALNRSNATVEPATRPRRPRMDTTGLPLRFTGPKCRISLVDNVASQWSYGTLKVVS